MSLIKAALLRLNSEGASVSLPFQWQLFEVHVPSFRPGKLDFFCFTSNARQIYGATASKSVCIIARKAVLTVEAAGLNEWKRALMRNNKSSLPALIQNGSRIQRGLKFRRR